MPRVVHFEIHATNPETLVAFYTGLFGWKLSRGGEMPCWMVETGVVPKMPVPGVGGLGDVKAPDGNVLGLMQSDPTVT